MEGPTSQRRRYVTHFKYRETPLKEKQHQCLLKSLGGFWKLLGAFLGPGVSVATLLDAGGAAPHMAHALHWHLMQ